MSGKPLRTTLRDLSKTHSQPNKDLGRMHHRQQEELVIRLMMLTKYGAKSPKGPGKDTGSGFQPPGAMESA